ncbi:MAG: hypothetical protein FWF12_06295 [Betaproteobacteria bacterium]|nr:hypothetical protein [Betaproteobacteria bacterium]
MEEQDLNERIDTLADMLLETERCVAKLAARESAMRAVLISLIVTHPNKKALTAIFEKSRAISNVKSFNVTTDDSLYDDSERALEVYMQVLESGMQL